MKLLIVSDNHGNQKILSILKHIYRNMYKDNITFFHLGDSQARSMQDLAGYICIKGNNDDLELPKSKEIILNHKKMYLTHGDEYEPIGYKEIKKDLKNYDFFIFGHTHMVIAKKYQNTWIFNPGSLTLPRDNPLGSYLLVDLDCPESYKVIRFRYDILEKNYSWLTHLED